MRGPFRATGVYPPPSAPIRDSVRSANLRCTLRARSPRRRQLPAVLSYLGQFSSPHLFDSSRRSFRLRVCVRRRYRSKPPFDKFDSSRARDRSARRHSRLKGAGGNLNGWELDMRRNLFAWIPVAGVLIQLAVCTAAIAANVNTTTTTKAKFRVTGVVKDALGRPIKNATLSLQGSTGKVVAHASSNDVGEFSFNAVGPGTYAIVATSNGFQTATSIVSVSAKGAAPMVVAMEAHKEVSIAVAATRLNKARNSLSPDTGGSKYTFTQQAIQELPQGANTSLNQVILQAPGVAQD